MIHEFSLKQLSPNDGIEIYKMLQRIGPSENAFNNEVNGMTYDNFQQWLIERDNWSKGEGLPKGYVKQWIFWLIVDKQPVGFGKLREKVTIESRKFGGNIGYAIDPLYRGNGYGKVLFGLLLEQASNMKIHEVYSTIEKPNHISKIIHDSYGGKTVMEDDKRWYYLFRI